MAASSVPDDKMAANAVMHASCCVAKTPMAPKATVASPIQMSKSPPNRADTPALAGNSSVHTRSTAYTPSLVMMAKSAATGAAALE